MENYIFGAMENLGVGIIIPDRNDRPEFLENCLRMINGQTIKPTIIEVVNDTPLNDFCDITRRYRMGYDRLRDKNLDCILFIENDDWYAPNYIETMLGKWLELGRPQLCGTQYTIYYHIGERSHYTFDHFRRSSAMNTLIIPDLQFDWGQDHNPYTDSWLWMMVKELIGQTFMPIEVISIGIKHGIGKVGGEFHSDKLHRYVNKDPDFAFIRGHMDDASFNFYSTYQI